MFFPINVQNLLLAPNKWMGKSLEKPRNAVGKPRETIGKCWEIIGKRVGPGFPRHSNDLPMSFHRASQDFPMIFPRFPHHAPHLLYSPS